MNLVGRPVYRLDNVEIDVAQGCLKRGGEEQYLRQQAFDVLLYLLEQRDRVVAKEELIASIWRHTAVTDNALVQCITEIRRALGDDSHQPRFIRTLPKLGYRFIGNVEEDWNARHDLSSAVGLRPSAAADGAGLEAEPSVLLGRRRLAGNFVVREEMPAGRRRSAAPLTWTAAAAALARVIIVLTGWLWLRPRGV